MRYHAKPYHPGQRLLGSVRGWKKHKRVREGDDLKSKQNTSMTVSKSQPHHLDTGLSSLTTAGLSRSGLSSLATADNVRNGRDLDCLLSLLLRMIWTVFSRYCWEWSGLCSLATADNVQNSMFSSSSAKSKVCHDSASCSSWDSCLTTQLGNSTDRIGPYFLLEWTLYTQVCKRQSWDIPQLVPE